MYDDTHRQLLHGLHSDVKTHMGSNNSNTVYIISQKLVDSDLVIVSKNPKKKARKRKVGQQK